MHCLITVRVSSRQRVQSSRASCIWIDTDLSIIELRHLVQTYSYFLFFFILLSQVYCAVLFILFLVTFLLVVAVVLCVKSCLAQRGFGAECFGIAKYDFTCQHICRQILQCPSSWGFIYKVFNHDRIFFFSVN